MADEDLTRTNVVLRLVLMVIFASVMPIGFIWLEEMAKNSENFLQLMFGAFIPLAIGTCILMFSRIEEAQRELKYIFYGVVISSLASSIFVAYSLAIVPRGGGYNQYSASSDTFDTFQLNLTFHERLGLYYGEGYQTIFTKNYPTCFVHVTGYGSQFGEDPEIRITPTDPTNMSGTLYLYIFLYHASDDYGSAPMRQLSFSFSETTIDFGGSSGWINIEIPSPYFRWGSPSEHKRMRLEGYNVDFILYLRLKGKGYGNQIHFTAEIRDSRFYVIDFQVDSALQNGIAILLCGVFAGIYVQILAKPLIKIRTHFTKKEEHS